MSFPSDQLLPPPAAHPGESSVGPVFAVLAVISILGVIAGVIGRLCFGRPVFGYDAHYNLNDWVDTKCASCLDGSLDPPPPPHLRRPPPPPETKEGGDGENLQSAPPGTAGE